MTAFESVMNNIFAKHVTCFLVLRSVLLFYDAQSFAYFRMNCNKRTTITEIIFLLVFYSSVAGGVNNEAVVRTFGLMESMQ